jgi:hypothetical protein
MSTVVDYEQLCRLQDKLVGAGSYLHKYPCEGFRSAELAQASSQPIGALLGQPKQYWVQVADHTLFWRKAPTASAGSKRRVGTREVDSICQGVRIIARARPIVAGQFRLCFTVTVGSRCLIFRAPSIRVLYTWVEALNRVVFDAGRPPPRVLNDNLLRALHEAEGGARAGRTGAGIEGEDEKEKAGGREGRGRRWRKEEQEEARPEEGGCGCG